jgi:hypothetical protein
MHLARAGALVAVRPSFFQLDKLPMELIDRLITAGFVSCGVWSLETAKLRCTLSNHAAAKNVLYAFVCGKEILYVGKSVQSLRKRMREYENPGPTQTTNLRANLKLGELLQGGTAVRILVFADNGLLHYGGFHLNLAAGLEDSIVRDLKPLWNVTGIPKV